MIFVSFAIVVLIDMKVEGAQFYQNDAELEVFESPNRPIIEHNSMVALHELLSLKSKEKYLFYSYPKGSMNENKVLEFVIESLTNATRNSEQPVMKDHVDYLRLYEKILASYEKRYFVRKPEHNSFLRNETFYLKNLIEKSSVSENSLRIDKSLVRDILRILVRLGEVENIDSKKDLSKFLKKTTKKPVKNFEIFNNSTEMMSSQETDKTNSTTTSNENDSEEENVHSTTISDEN
jgi:hypothetical protein